MAPTFVAFSNNKGGVGKTSMSTAVAARAAKAGLRALLVDLDKQGNTAPRFGLERYDDDNDEGAGLLGALMLNQPLAPVRLRDNIDVIAGGHFTEQLADHLSLRIGKEGIGALAALRERLDTVAGNYDLVILDTSVNTTIMNAALIAADWLVIPTKGDLDSTDGMEVIAELFNAAREKGLSKVELAGVVLYDVESNATRLKTNVRRYIDQSLGGTGHIFNGTIRHSTATSTGMREVGLSAEEYAEKAAGQEPWFKRRGKETDPDEHVFASPAAAAALASDFDAVTTEILQRIGLFDRVTVDDVTYAYDRDADAYVDTSEAAAQ